ncbi:hypothetical protein EV426DRAFT_575284 [Tirmania nivea]|nr:hypothetical protein EV426DRAFT_575284 [Tirmania nivea]
MSYPTLNTYTLAMQKVTEIDDYINAATTYSPDYPTSNYSASDALESDGDGSAPWVGEEEEEEPVTAPWEDEEEEEKPVPAHWEDEEEEEKHATAPWEDGRGGMDPQQNRCTPSTTLIYPEKGRNSTTRAATHKQTAPRGSPHRP